MQVSRPAQDTVPHLAVHAAALVLDLDTRLPAASWYRPTLHTSDRSKQASKGWFISVRIQAHRALSLRSTGGRTAFYAQWLRENGVSNVTQLNRTTSRFDIHR